MLQQANMEVMMKSEQEATATAGTSRTMHLLKAHLKRGEIHQS